MKKSQPILQNMTKLNDMTYSEYMHMAHDIEETNESEGCKLSMVETIHGHLLHPQDY